MLTKGHVLLINPWLYDFAAYNEWMEPQGLLSVAAVLRENGYTLSLIDCLDRWHPDLLKLQGRETPKSNEYGCGKFHKTFLDKPAVLDHVPRRYGRYGLPLEIFEAELDRQPRPDAILVTSGMTYWYPGPFEAIRRAKARWPNVPVILGGIYATLCPDHARQKSGADFVIHGEGELQTLRLVDSLIDHPSRYDKYSHPSTTLRPFDGAQGRLGSGQGSGYDLDSYPFPAHDLRRNQGYVAITTSRGCPYRCTYCASHRLNPQGFRQRDPQRVVAEIEWCRPSTTLRLCSGQGSGHCTKLDVRDFAFYDDALLVNAQQHIHVILDEVIARGLDCRFHTPNGLHAELIDESLAAKMFQAGFKTVRLGLESGDPEEQRRSGGKVTNEGFRRAVAALRSAGFEAANVTAYVMLGLPGQHIKDVEESITFAHQCGATVEVTLYSPIPGTAEWERAVHHWGLDPQADPLLHNESAYPLQSEALDVEAFERVKALAGRGNQNLKGPSGFGKPEGPGSQEL
ncbi:MAG: radical SAM protein [Anaerolineales bacterium]|nr:MAG: radical SAM protein [Anaerolineales bacterium]